MVLPEPITYSLNIVHTVYGIMLNQKSYLAFNPFLQHHWHIRLRLKTSPPDAADVLLLPCLLAVDFLFGGLSTLTTLLLANIGLPDWLVALHCILDVSLRCCVIFISIFSLPFEFRGLLWSNGPNTGISCVAFLVWFTSERIVCVFLAFCVNTI